MNFLKGFSLAMFVSIMVAAALIFADGGWAWGELISFVFWTVPFALLLGVVVAPFFRTSIGSSFWERLGAGIVVGSLVSFGWTFVAGLVLGPWGLLFSFPVGLCWIAAGCGVVLTACGARHRSFVTMSIVSLIIAVTIVVVGYGVRYALDKGERYVCAARWRDVPNDSLVIINEYEKDLSGFESEVRAIFDHGELVVGAHCPDRGAIDASDGVSRTLVVMEKPLMAWTDLAFPRKGEKLIYVQAGDAWKAYPENAPVSGSHFSLGPWSRFIETLADGSWRMEAYFSDTEECRRSGPGISCAPFLDWDNAPRPQRYITSQHPARFDRSKVRLEE